MTQEDRNFIGERVEVQENSESVAKGILEEIRPDYDEWDRILQKYGVGSWTYHTPSRPATMCLVVSNEDAHICPLRSVRPTSDL